jgi:hypothetical protein
MHPVDELVAALATSRRQLLGAVERLAQEDLDRRPAAGAWSPGEVLDHLAKSEAGTVNVCGRLLREAVSAGAGSDAALGSQLRALDFAELDDRERRHESPDFVRPDQGAARDDLLNRLAASRVGLLDVARRARGTDLTHFTFPHPLLGPLTLYQWFVFVAQHEARHTLQIPGASPAA